MSYGLGIDCGIASVGSGTVLLNEKEEPYKIDFMGVRTFDKAETGTGKSLAAERRSFRGSRRTHRRKTHRKDRIKKLICDTMNVDFKYIQSIYERKSLSDIYEIRYEALNRKLTKDEFIRLLIHLSQRRGFKSNRKIDAKNKNSDDGKMLKEIEKNKSIFTDNGYRTIGEMLFKNEKFIQRKRNKSDYSMTFLRVDYENEIKVIFNQQRKFNNQHATESFENEYLKIYLSQRNFDDGPDESSPYGGNLIGKMVKNCTFEPTLKAAPKASYSFEYSNLLTKVNSMKILYNGNRRPLTKEEREKVVNLAFKKNKITYSSIRTELGLSNEEFFNISYNSKDYTETEKKTKFSYLTAYYEFKKAYGSSYLEWSVEKKNTLATILTLHKNDSKIIEEMKEKNFLEDEINVALTIPSFTKFGNLSIAVLNKMIPYLEDGMLYNEAITALGYNFKDDDKCQQMYLPSNPKDAPELDEIRNPVVRRTVSQTIKVINSIIREKGESPTYINIELARELAKSYKERKNIESNQKSNREKNEKSFEELKKLGVVKPTAFDLVKYKLWKEQDGICVYSQKPLEIEKLFSEGYAEVDHIVPYSISFDDSYSNKVLVHTNENQNKGNRIPLNYLSGKERDEFIVWVKNSHLSFRKKQNLLKEKISEDDFDGFKNRNLKDTQYLSRFLLKFIKKYLKFAPSSTNRKETVIAVNGAITSYIRKRWGIEKIRANGDAHHATDAIVIACVTKSMIKRISEYSKYKETLYIKNNDETLDVDKKTGEVKNYFPMPYKWFRTELDIRCSKNPERFLESNPLPTYARDEKVKPIFVSRMVDRKVTGPAHQDTLRRMVVENGQKYEVVKTDLNKLSLDNNNEIANYYNPDDDRLLYDALKNHLIKFNELHKEENDKKKEIKSKKKKKVEDAFTEPFYKPKSDGSKGPLVKSVKIIKKITSSVTLNNNTTIAKNGDMIRTDVFRTEDGYYLVPIYVADTVKNELPHKAIVQGGEWKAMNDEDFLFSLYRNDLIKIKSNSDVTFSLMNESSSLPKTESLREEFVYFKGTSINTASIRVVTHDNCYIKKSLGVKNLQSLEKYQVDVLGNVSKVKKEKRMGFR